MANDIQLPIARTKSCLFHQVITPQSLHSAYGEHDLETCAHMIEEASEGGERLSFEAFKLFMRSAETIMLDDVRLGDPSNIPHDSKLSQSPLLIKNPRCSEHRPALLKQISGVVV